MSASMGGYLEPSAIIVANEFATLHLSALPNRLGNDQQGKPRQRELSPQTFWLSHEAIQPLQTKSAHQKRSAWQLA